MSDIRIDTSGLNPLISRVRPARERMVATLATQVQRDTEKYVPMLTGSQVRRTRIEGSKIIYGGPYARYLYEGKVMEGPRYGPKHATDKNLVYTTQHHAKATSHWFDESKKSNIKTWQNVARRAFLENIRR